MDEVSLKEYVESIFTGQKETVAAALVAQKEITAAALASSERAVLKAEATTQAGFASVIEKIDAQNERFERIHARLDTMAGQSAGVTNSWKILIGAISLVATVLTIFYLVAK